MGSCQAYSLHQNISSPSVFSRLSSCYDSITPLVYFQAKPRGEAAEAVELEIAVRHAEPSDLGMQVLSIPQIVARFFFVPLNFIGNPS